MPVQLPTDSNFERTFADLAFVRLKDKAPTLLDHLVGFQLVDKNDEETHAVGVFGFKIGEDWVYAPVFFINGELKGYELLYLKAQDAFVPLTEEWVNYILNRKPSILGESEPRKVTQMGVRPPDFDVFSRPPYLGSKYASARKPLKERMRKWAHPFLEVFAISPKDEIFSSVEKSFSLPIALKRLGTKAAACLFKTMEKDSRFAEAVLRFYKESELANFAKTAAAYTKAEADYTEDAVMRQCRDCGNYQGGSCSTVKGDVSPSASCKFWAAKLGKESADDSVPFDEQADGRKPKNAPVVIVRGDDESNVTVDMTDADREKLMRNDYVVHDPRKPEEKTRAYESQLSAQLSSPMENGIYEVLGPGGERKRVVVFKDMTKIGLRRPESADQFLVAIDPETKACGKYYSMDLLAFEKLAPLEDLDLTDPADSEMGDWVSLIGPKGNKCTNPFEIDRIDTDEEGVTTMDVSSCYIPASSSGTGAKSYMNRQYPIDDTTVGGDPGYISSIVLTGKEGDEWKQVGNALYVPSNIKAYRIKRLTPKERRNRPEPWRGDKPELELATSGDILCQLSKSAAAREGIVQMQIKTDGLQYWTRVNGGNSPLMSKAAAVKTLVEKWGLGGDTAESLLSEVKPRQSKTYWLKLAQEYTGVMSPSFQEPPVGQESWIRSPVQYPLTEIQNLENASLSGNKAFYEDLGPMEEDAQQMAMQAADQGQKEVLDTAVISGIVKLMDVDTRVDSYIGDLLLGLDRLGRILFMYYWHNDKFSERYGQEDMAKLEDSLRNVFSSLGELTLFLKQKTIDAEAMDSEAELTSVLQ